MVSSDNSSETETLASPSRLASGASSSRETKNANLTAKKSSSKNRARREAIVLIFVILFVLNSINGRKVVQSVNSQFDELTKMVYYSPPTPPSTPKRENRTEDTAVIITSSWIPSHPSTHMVDAVVNSTLRHIVGLSATAPIFITIDHFRYSDFTGLTPEHMERINKLEEYTVNLLNNYMTDPRIHVIQAAKQLHIGGSVMKALNLVERHYPTVRYVYYLQHDFYFSRDVDHLALVRAMDDHPDKINYVRFPKRQPFHISRQCGDEKAIQYNRTLPPDASGNATAQTLTLWPTSSYSDNNHLVRFGWYKKTIASLIKLNRAPEDPLQRRANNGCWNNPPRADDITGLYLYHEMCIGHLDGRHTPGSR